MGRVLRTFLVTLLVLGLVVAVALGALVFGGTGLARNLAEAYVSNLTGRELVIEGSFEPVWGRRLDVTAENLRLTNADWAVDEQMLTISRLRVVLDLWTLVNRPLLLDAIEIDAARLKLEKHDTHGDNWDIFPPDDTDAPGLDLVIRQIRVDESTIRYEAPNFDRSLVISIDDLDQDLNAAGLLDTHLKGDINELPLEFSGELGPFDNLLAGTNIKFAVEGKLRNSVLLAQGEIDNLVNPRQPRLDLSVRSPDGGELTDKAPGSRDISSTTDLGMSWPQDVYSLSHVALPFPTDDPLYGPNPPEDDDTLHFGEIALRGERDLYKLPGDWLVRMRYNPFYDLLESRTLQWIDAAGR